MSHQLKGYELYKRDTETYLTWIFTTAKSHGGKFHDAKNSSSDVSKHERRSQFVTVQAILDQASFLASLSKILIMPLNIQKSFRRAVNARKRCAERHATITEGSLEKEDGHVHFIWVLEEAARILGPVVSVQNIAKPRRKTIADDQDVSNAFLLLQIDGEESDFNTGDMHVAIEDLRSEIDGPAPKSALPDVYTPMIDEESDFQFRYSCEIEEAERILEHLRVVAADYENGKMHLASFAFIVDAAIELVGHNETQLLDEAADRGHELALPVSESSNLFLPFVTLFNYSTTGGIMAPLSRRFPHMADAIMEEDDRYLVQYITEVLREQIFRESCQAGMDFVGKSQSLPRSCHDMASKALLIVANDKEVTLQAIFAAATLLLIKHTLRDLPAANVKLGRINQGINASLDRVNNSGIEIPPELMGVCRVFLSVQSWVRKEPVPDTDDSWKKVRCQLESKGLLVPTEKVDFLRESSPVACGSSLTSLYALFEEFGMCMVNFSPHVFSMCYLYTALKQKRHVSGSWDAIEKVIARFPKDIYLGQTACDLDAMLNRFKLASGMSLTSLTTSLRNLHEGHANPLVHSFSKTKSWRLTASPASDILRNYAHDRKTFITTLHHLDSLIARTNNAESMLEDGRSVIDFLKVLPDALENIFTALRMDYLTLDAQCRVLFRRMAKSLMGLPPMSSCSCCQSWAKHTARSFLMVCTIMREMIEAEQVEEYCSNGFAELQTPRIDLAKKVVGNHLETLTGNAG